MSVRCWPCGGLLRSLVAFTLVELLVVVGIISLLMTTLMPQMQRALDLAGRANCLSNLHSIHTSMAMYDADMRATPPASRHMNQEAFGAGSATLGFGLLTWNGYCGSPGLLACPRANYTAGSERSRSPGDPDGPPDWISFTRPKWFPGRGMASFWYGDGQGNSLSKGYGNTSSYSYRRANTPAGYGPHTNEAPGIYYIHYEKRSLHDEAFPKAYVACSQMLPDPWQGEGGENTCHKKQGSGVLYKNGAALWLDMTEEFLPYRWPHDYGFGPLEWQMFFWGTADARW